MIQATSQFTATRAPGPDGPATWSLWPLALIVGLWPILICHLALLLSIASGTLDPALPYIDGRYSVSAAARQDPTVYWFRIAMMPYAPVLGVFWWLNDRWLAGWQKERRVSRRLVLICGLAGAALMLVYTSFLGTEGAIYTWLRRFGAVMFFAGTALAQLISVRVLWHSTMLRHPRFGSWLAAACTASGILVLLGLCDAILPLLIDTEIHIGNLIEWYFGVVMNAWFIVFAVLWRRSRFSFRLV